MMLEATAQEILTKLIQLLKCLCKHYKQGDGKTLLFTFNNLNMCNIVILIYFTFFEM